MSNINNLETPEAKLVLAAFDLAACAAASSTDKDAGPQAIRVVKAAREMLVAYLDGGFHITEIEE